MAGNSEHSIENVVSVKGGKYLAHMSDHLIFKEGSSPWSLLYYPEIFCPASLALRMLLQQRCTDVDGTDISDFSDDSSIPTKPHRDKSSSAISGDRGDQINGPSLSIHLPGNISC